MELAISRDSTTPVYLQIFRQIRDRIVNGDLGVGQMLPPERRLASELGVNRSTVLSAYRALKEDGLVAGHVGRGTTVLQRTPAGPIGRTGRPMPWRQHFQRGGMQAHDPLVRDLLERAGRDDAISLGIGTPAPELLPLESCSTLHAEILNEIGPASLLHSPTEGLPELRETLSTWMQARGVDCDPAEIIVLSGSQQGLDLAARSFVDPGDVVIVEGPSFFGALQAFRSAQARLVPVPVDEHGMRTDLLAPLLELHRPKFIYTLPTFQNPSGTVMSLGRRRHLLELAAAHGVPVLEDDPYSELRYDGDALPSLKSLDQDGIVLYLSTMSKVLFPGLRLGWLVAPRPVVRQFALLKQTLDLHSGTMSQWMLDRFIRRGWYDRHIDVVRRAYAKRRDAMHAALRRRTPHGLVWHKPEGGFYFWCRLPDGVERACLVARATESGVTFLPGWGCFVEDDGAAWIRLNFAYPPEEQIRTGVSRLLSAIRRCASRAPAAHQANAGTPPIV